MNRLTHKFDIRVRYAHTDAMGIVYNANYLHFFEIGRTELMRSFGLPYVEVEKNGILLPLIDVYSKFISPARYDDILTIVSELDWNGGARLKFLYELYCGDSQICSGFTSHAFVNSTTMQATKPPRFFIDVVNNSLRLTC